MEKASFRFQQEDSAGFMHNMGCLLLKQTLAVCLVGPVQSAAAFMGRFYSHVVSDNKARLPCKPGH